FPMCGDDSFIDFRYVKNWVNHTSFDYNPGEAVLGFTSYVHVGILTLLSFLLPLIDLPLLSQLTNVSFQLLNCCIIYFFLLDLSGNRWSALSGAAVYTLDPFSVQQSTFGKEAPILLFVLTLSLWAILRRKHQALAWLSCLIPFIRPEGAIFSSICLAWSLKDNGPKVLKLWIAPILIAASFTFLVFSYFGTIVPHGMIGKLKMFYPSSYPKIFFMALWMMGTGLFIPRFYIDRPGLYYGLGSVLFGFILLSIFIYVARGHVHRIYALSLVAYLLIFLGKNPEAFSWYLVWFALFPVFFVSILVSLLLELKDKSRLSMILCLVLLADIFLVQIAQQVKRPSPGLASLTFSWSPELDRLIKFEKALECIYKEPGGRTA
ncbi:MAG: hypothetical protein K8F91_21070, partial [Candidatus Obscuribacterales bacterium]|nr:hypothetical protein [Candidatus Obscuribacterales bacterium]